MPLWPLKHASPDYGAFDRLRASIDPDWIDQALELTGTVMLSHRLGSARARGPREESALDDAGLRQHPLSSCVSSAKGMPRRDGGLASGSATRTGYAQDPGGAGRRLPTAGFKPQTLLTSLYDAEKHPAKELAAPYDERREIELGYDEVNTEMLERREHIRSKKPEGVEQEMCGLALAYNLIRLEILRIAREARLPSRRISFVAAHRLICDERWWSFGTPSPGPIPEHLRRLREDIERFVLPPRRSERSYPRGVKIKMTPYLGNAFSRSALCGALSERHCV